MINQKTTKFSVWKALFVMLASSASVKSYTVNTPTSFNVPKLINENLISSVNIRDHQSSYNNNVQKKKRVTYDLGLGKNRPFVDVNDESVTPVVLPTSEAASYLIEHEGVNAFLPEGEWFVQLKSQYQNDNKVPATKKTLPTVQLHRITNDNEIRIESVMPRHPSFGLKHHTTSCAPRETILKALAQTSITRNYDLNTPWIEMLIQNEKQKIINIKLQQQQQQQKCQHPIVAPAVA